MATNNTKIIGMDAITKVFRQLPNAVVDKEVQNILMRNAKPAMQDMKDNVGDHTGKLKKSMKLKRGKFKKDAIDVWGGVQNTRFSKAPHWHIVAEGTGERKIDSYKTSPKTKLKDSKNGRGIRVAFGGVDVRFITSTGKMPQNRYATKALATSGGVLSANTRDVDKYLARKAKALITKYKLDKNRR